MGALGGRPEVQGVQQGAQGAAPSLASLEPPNPGGQTMGVLWGTGIGQFFFSIRKQHSVDKVHTL